MSRRVAVGAAMRLPASDSRLQYLQLFLTPELLQSWAQLTDDALGRGWRNLSARLPAGDQRLLPSRPRCGCDQSAALLLFARQEEPQVLDTPGVVADRHLHSQRVQTLASSASRGATPRLSHGACSRTHGMSAAQAKATAHNSISPWWCSAGQRALLSAVARTRGLQALQSTTGRQSDNSICLRQVRCTSMHWRLLCSLSCMSVDDCLNIHVRSFVQLRRVGTRQSSEKFWAHICAQPALNGYVIVLKRLSIGSNLGMHMRLILHDHEFCVKSKTLQCISSTTVTSEEDKKGERQSD